jgi:hypothetical protein
MDKKKKIGFSPLEGDKVCGSIIDKIEIVDTVDDHTATIKPAKRATDFSFGTLKFLSSDDSVKFAPTANAGEIDFTVDVPTPPTPSSQPLYRIINLREAIGWIAEAGDAYARASLDYYADRTTSYRFSKYNTPNLGAPAKTFLHFRLGEEMMELTENKSGFFIFDFGNPYADGAPSYTIYTDMVYDPNAMTYTFDFNKEVDGVRQTVTSRTVSKNNREFMFNINELGIPTNVKRYLRTFGLWSPSGETTDAQIVQHDEYNAFQFVLVYDSKF